MGDKPATFYRIQDLLQRTRHNLAPLLVQAGRLHAVEQIIYQSLHASQVLPCRVANIKNGDTLLLQTDSPVWATRLRYQTPKLLETLRNTPEWGSIQHIRIQVRPAAHPPRSRPSRRINLSHQNATLLRTTAESLTDPRLKSALLRLACRESRHQKEL
jgi:hypothetical protein